MYNINENETGTNNYSISKTFNVLEDMLECSKCQSQQQLALLQQQRADCLQNTVKYLLDLIEICGDTKCRRILRGTPLEDTFSVVDTVNSLCDDDNLFEVDSQIEIVDMNNNANSDIITEVCNHKTIKSTKTVVQSQTSETSDIQQLTIECYTQIKPCDITSSSLTPYAYFGHTPMVEYSAEKLVESTTFTTELKNRSIVYYGDIPYSYGNISHDGNNNHSLEENVYLVEILKSIKSCVPFLSFNSVMVQVYNGLESGIPPHSDDEISICPGSQILTLSLGKARYIEFESKDKSVSFSRLLEHGSILTMSQGSQNTYKHTVPTDQDNGFRVSITLRLLRNCDPIDTNIKINKSPINNMEIAEDAVSEISIVESSSGSNRQCVQVIVDNTVNNQNHQLPTGDNKKSDVIYISSSMFSRFNAEKLSSKTQRAHVFSYSGKDANDMLKHLMDDPKFKIINTDNVSKVYILTGTNDVQKLYYGRKISDTYQALERIFLYLYNRFYNATINILNLFARDIKRCNDIVNNLNDYIFDISNSYGRMTFIDTQTNLMFSDRAGNRRKEFFWDSVHLNNDGIVRLCTHLKFISHDNKI